MKKTLLARMISVLLHPLIMPSMGMIMIFNSGTYVDFLTSRQQRAIFIIYLTGTVILPLSIIPLLLLRRMVTDLALARHRERVFPLMVTVLFYGFTWHMLSRLEVPGLITVYSLTATVAVLLVALVSLKWKISLHMTALGALAGMLLAISLRYNVNLHLLLSVVILLGGIAGWARLFLRAHTPAQVYAGYLLGLSVALLMIYSY